MVRPIDLSPYLSVLKEIVVGAGHEVLVEIDDNSLLIVENPGYTQSAY